MKKFVVLLATLSMSNAQAVEQQLRRLTTALTHLKDDLSKPKPPPRDDDHLQPDIHTQPPPVPPVDEDLNMPPAIPPIGKPLPAVPPQMLPHADEHDGPLPPLPATTQQEPEIDEDRPVPPIGHVPEDEPLIPDDSKDAPHGGSQPAQQAHVLNSMPPMELKQSITKEIYSPLNKTLKTVENQTLKAIIGITSDDDMIVWGPQLKTEPKVTTFIQKNRTFNYPNSDAIQLKIENGKVSTQFVPYIIVNMKDLRAQKQQFDELRNAYSLIASKRADVLDAAKYGSYIDTFQGLIAQVQAAFKNGPLAGVVYPVSLGSSTISTHDVHRLMEGVQALYKELVSMVQMAQNKAQKTKNSVYAEWKSQGTPDNLLEGRWEKAGQYAQARRDLLLLPAILTKLQSVDTSPVAALGVSDDQRALIGNYYNHLHKTGLEDALSESFSDGADSDEENAAPNQERTEKEEDEMDELSKEIGKNIVNWQVPNLPPLKVAEIKSKLSRYLKLKRKSKEDADWRPLGKIFTLYSYYGVNF